jgi:hypothetical protein
MDRFLRALLIFLTTARCDTESDYALSRVNDQVMVSLCAPPRRCAMEVVSVSSLVDEFDVSACSESLSKLLWDRRGASCANRLTTAHWYGSSLLS